MQKIEYNKKQIIKYIKTLIEKSTKKQKVRIQRPGVIRKVNIFLYFNKEGQKCLLQTVYQMKGLKQ